MYFVIVKLITDIASIWFQGGLNSKWAVLLAGLMAIYHIKKFLITILVIAVAVCLYKFISARGILLLALKRIWIQQIL